MANDRHPGITMHKISFGGGFIGLLFAAGSALIFVLGFPTLWYFVVLALGLGVIIAIVLKTIHDHTTERNRPLSIVEVPRTKEPLVFSRREKIPKQFHTQAHSAPA
jgi:hypothetical protein